MRPRAAAAAMFAALLTASAGAAVPTSAAAQAAPVARMTEAQIIAALRSPENSTGNVADAVEAATGARGWMSADMKPISERKIVGRAWTALLRPSLTNDTAGYPNLAMQIIDEAPAGAVLVYVMQDGLQIAGMGNLMATAAHAQDIEATVIDGAVRDVREIRQIGHQVFARRISPATSVGRMVSVAKNVPVMCAEVMVRPGDYIVGDTDGVVVVPAEAAEKVIALLKEYDDKESKMIPIIKREKSMQKALDIYGRY